MGHEEPTCHLAASDDETHVPKQAARRTSNTHAGQTVLPAMASSSRLDLFGQESLSHEVRMPVLEQFMVSLSVMTLVLGSPPLFASLDKVAGGVLDLCVEDQPGL